MRKIAVFTLFVFIASFASAQDDRIPENCPYPEGAHYDANWIVRLHPAEQRITIADWSTGETVHTIESTQPDAHLWPVGWSPSCRYLILGYTAYMPSTGYYHRRQTAIYDLLNGTEVSRFAGGIKRIYPLTWEPGDARVLVETRFGAFIHTIGGGDVWLTSRGGDSVRSFREGSVVWDTGQNRISGQLQIPPYGIATYDLGSGALLALTDSAGNTLDPAAADYTVKGRPNGELYRCMGDHIEDAFVRYNAANKRLALVDSGTMDQLRVLVEDADYALYRKADAPVFLDNCTKLRMDFSPHPVTFDLVTGERTIHTEE